MVDVAPRRDTTDSDHRQRTDADKIRRVLLVDDDRDFAASAAEVARIARIGHSVWDEREHREVYSSEKGDRIWGTPPGKLSDFDDFLASVHPDDRARVEAVIEQAYENRTGYAIEYKIVRPDGETRFVRECADAELDDAGKLVATVITVQDIAGTRPSRPLAARKRM